MGKYLPHESDDLIDELLRRNAVLERQVIGLDRRLKTQGGGTPLHRLDIANYPQPYEGQRAIDIQDEQHAWYSNGQWRKAGGAVLFIKVKGDRQIVIVEDQAFEFEVSEDMDGAVLTRVESYVSTASTSGGLLVQLRKVAGSIDILSTLLSIDANELNSKDAATQPVINTANDNFAWGDHIAIDVDSSGSGAKGLGVMLTFGAT